MGVDTFQSTRAGSIAGLEADGIRVLNPEIGDPVSEHVRRSGGDYDVVLLSRGHVARKYIDEVRRFAPAAKVVFDTTDLSFARGIRAAKVTGNASLLRQALEAKRDELYAARESDVTLIVSKAEQEILERECPGVVSHVVSLIQTVAPSAPPVAGREGILFVGAASHLPNLDGIAYFFRDVTPLFRGELPRVKTRIVGSNPPDSVTCYASETCLVLGHVPDLTPLFNSSMLSIAPLRFGAGVKGKVLMSMAHGLPVVASPVAVEGIPAVDGRDILIADSPSAFSRKIVDLHSDAGLWSHVSANGRAVIGRHFSPTAAREAIADLLVRLDLKP